MQSIDTNVVLRLLLRDVPGQLDKANSLIDKASHNGLAVNDAVFFECVWILSGKMYGFEREHIARLLLQIIEIPQINCNNAMLEKALPLYAKHPAISFIDACLSVYAELDNAKPLLTFDKKLAASLPKNVTSL